MDMKLCCCRFLFVCFLETFWSANVPVSKGLFSSVLYAVNKSMTVKTKRFQKHNSEGYIPYLEDRNRVSALLC